MLDQFDRCTVTADPCSALPRYKKLVSCGNAWLVAEVNSLKDDSVIFRSGQEPQRHVGSRQKTNTLGACFFSDRSLVSCGHSHSRPRHCR
jgi:hypothetical protein